MASKDSKSPDDKVDVGDGAIEPVADSSSVSAASQDRDETYDVYKQSRLGLETTPAEAKKVLRKIDTRLLPILILTYMLQYLDKNSINFASVYGLKEGTGLEGQDYSWLGMHIPTCLWMLL